MPLKRREVIWRFLDVVDALDLFRLWRVLEVFDAPADGAEADLVAVSRSDCDVSARLGWATSRLGGLPSGNPWLGGVTAALVLIALLTAGFAWCAFPMCGRLRLHHRLAEPMTDLLLERKRSYWMFSLWFVDLPFFTIRCVYFFGYGVPVSTFLARNVVDIGGSNCTVLESTLERIVCVTSAPLSLALDGGLRGAAAVRARRLQRARRAEQLDAAAGGMHRRMRADQRLPGARVRRIRGRSPSSSRRAGTG